MIRCIILLCLTYQAFGQRCPLGWLPFKDNCYKFSDRWFSWDDARAVCKARQGDLADVRTLEERDFIVGEIRSRRQHFWFGLNDKAREGKYVWPDGSPLDNNLALWAKNQPNNWKNRQDCGLWQIWNSTEVSWNDGECYANYRYICKRSINTVDKCDFSNGWVPFGDKCFRLEESKLSWRDALARCKSMDGNLVGIDTQEKLRMISDTVTCTDTNNAVWIGLSDIKSPGNLAWADGVAVTITNWDVGQPKLAVPGGENCVEVLANTRYKWRVTACDVEKKAICERPQGTF
ncbi:unnamed protein product [Owenia fusiformis]|uniref:Uncharacterized protein n=1 Tax=Owenia fusiformis TaxID=6347 RepID=A0A8J1TVT3_OWEFU|nr:unnamed protein product [Owenia fusiformis]